jgi:hypothetical protein
MRMRTSILAAALALLATLAPAQHNVIPMTKIVVVVKSPSNKPLERASVVVRFEVPRSLETMGFKPATSYELRTNQEGEASVPEIPQGQVQIQVIAKGYQTFGKRFEVTEETKTIEIKLNPPQKQYSSYD